MHGPSHYFDGLLRRPFIFYSLALPMLGLLWLAFPEPSGSTFDYVFFFGPAVRSFVLHGNFAQTVPALTPDQPNLVFHACRRPLIPLFLGLLARISPSSVLAFFVKNGLAIVALLAAYRAYFSTFTRVPLGVRFGVFLLVFANPYLWSQLRPGWTEEGYLIPLVAWASVLMMRVPTRERDAWAAALIVSLLVLIKSSMGPLALVLACGLALRPLRARLVPLGALGLTLLGLAFANAQHGRFTTTSSFDTWNLYKGNNEKTLEYLRSSRLDQLESGFLIPTEHLSDEWAFSDYYARKTRAFVTRAPGPVVELYVAKFVQAFVTPYFPYPGQEQPLKTGVNIAVTGMLRLVMWLGVGFTLRTLVRHKGPTAVDPIHPEDRRVAASYLAFLVAYLTPYLLGFLYQRHLSPLFFPVFTFCSVLAPSASRRGGSPSSGTPQASRGQ
jgi:hypothetical protein